MCPYNKEDENLVKASDFVNLTEKMVKADVPDDGLYVPGVYLWSEDNLIKGMKGNDIIFEVTNRSKAYKELEQYARTKLDSIKLIKKEGDYGPYYRLQVSRRVSRDEAFGK